MRKEQSGSGPTVRPLFFCLIFYFYAIFHPRPLLYNWPMNKFIYIIIGLVVVFGAIIIGTSKYRETVQVPSVNRETGENSSTNTEGRQNFGPGAYKIDAASDSKINWSGKKPLILGYVDSGTIPISQGEIVVYDDDTPMKGSFVFNVSDLHVGNVAKKPGQEGGLERHLKSDAFFNVEKYPTATFTLKDITTREGSDDQFELQIIGDLKIKDITHEISFPATVYNKDEALHIQADTQIDRTKWDMTFASGNFFQNLGDGLVDDMVSISFNLVMPRSSSSSSASTDRTVEAI